MVMIDSHETFESYRPLMFSIAYRMLGSTMDAEDIVQEAYLRYQRAEHIRTPKALLTTIVTRLCLDQLKSAREQRESYIGPWLPEPLVTTPLDDTDETISMAFLVLLESLNPVERAVFLLREVFDYDYREIAEIVGKEEAACRQSFHRAKAHLADNRPRFQASAAEHQQMLQKFMEACLGGELEGLTRLLSDDVVLLTDGGGKASAATRPLHTPDVVSRFLFGIVSRMPGSYPVEFVSVNGKPAILVRDPEDKPFWLHMLALEDGKISAFYVIRNPDKLRAFER
jgi:RNA polymerase sigma-70 factor (ECF subfamily)